MRGCVIRGCVTRGRVMRGCVMRGCVIRGCVTRGRVMRGSVMRGCVMSGCVVRGCVMRGRVMRGCVMSGCVMNWSQSTLPAFAVIVRGRHMQQTLQQRHYFSKGRTFVRFQLPTCHQHLAQFALPDGGELQCTSIHVTLFWLG